MTPEELENAHRFGEKVAENLGHDIEVFSPRHPKVKERLSEGLSDKSNQAEAEKQYLLNITKELSNIIFYLTMDLRLAFFGRFVPTYKGKRLNTQEVQEVVDNIENYIQNFARSIAEETAGKENKKSSVDEIFYADLKEAKKRVN